MKTIPNEPINKFIKAAKVRLISSSGEQLGIKSIDDALSIASKENLDLVQLNEDKDTPNGINIRIRIKKDTVKKKLALE